jgi:tRNA (uracil-5-)-methyltransferase TRM9
MSSVSDTYNSIAKEFDKTRFSVWQGVRKFLDTLPANSTLCEVGCGNGKNLLYRSDLITKGYDVSNEMVQICCDKGLNVETADIIDLNIVDNSFDNVMSIAVIHHLSSKESRVKAISELLRITKAGGRVLITVWAFEQPPKSKRKFNAGDNLVPFVNKNGKSVNRFYHIYTEGELQSELNCITDDIEKICWELGNWCAVIKKR